MQNIPVYVGIRPFIWHHISHTERGKNMLYFSACPDECQELPTVLKPIEVAEFLCIHKNTVYKLIRRGDLPAFRVGKSWRIQRSDLFHLLDRSESE